MPSRRKDHVVGALLSIVLLFDTMAVAEASAPMEQMRQTVNDLVAIFENIALSSPDRAQKRRAKIQQVLSQRIEKYGRKQKSAVFKDESLHAEGTASVHIVIVDPRGPTINEDVGYRLQKHQDVWLVHALLMDGSSIITHFRTQFDQIIRQESYCAHIYATSQSILLIW